MFTDFYKNTIKIFEKNRKIILIFVFLLIVFLSFVPRSVEVLNRNPIFLFDQGREMLAAKNIVVNHKLILIGTEVGAGQAGVSGIFHGPIYYYMLTIPFVLFNGDPASIVFLMLLFGLLTILFGYYFGKKLFGKLGGILLALLISISPVFIAQSRFLWSPNPPTLFIFISLYFTYLFTVSKKKLHLFLATFFAAFIYNFELGIAVPLSLTLLVYSLFIFRKKLKDIMFLFFGFIVGYLPMLLFEVRHGFLGTKSIISYLTTSHRQIAEHSSVYYLLDHAKAFLGGFQNTFSINMYFAIFLLLIVSLSIYFLIREKNINFKYYFSFLLLLIPITFFVFAPLRNIVWNIYLLHLNASYLLLFCYIAYSFFSKKLNKLFTLMVFFIVVLTLAGINSAIQTWVHDYPDYGATSKLRGKIDALDYIYKDANGKPFGLLVFTPPVYTYPYDYLLWWYGKRKYNYLPYRDKKGITYLLIEPDPNQPWSYKGWLETVIKNGTILKTVNLPSGFIIQERKY